MPQIHSGDLRSNPPVVLKVTVCELPVSAISPSATVPLQVTGAGAAGACAIRTAKTGAIMDRAVSREPHFVPEADLSRSQDVRPQPAAVQQRMQDRLGDQIFQ